MVRSLRHIAFVVTVAMTTALAAMSISARSSASTYRFEHDPADIPIRIVATPTDGGIREEIPLKYRERYEKWKSELRATDLGREQWDKYASNKSFILTIVVSGGQKGAGTDKYLWNDEGQLVGATITLSAALQDGSPPPIYYPVLNSLSTDTTTYSISGPIVAATRLSHELGHVNQTSEASMKLIQQQNNLIVQYNSIFMENGLNSKDTRLLDLATQLKGTPVQIWESREYWSEVNAMLYLSQRISKENFYCFVFKKIRHNLETHAKAYEDRFSKYPEFNNSPCWN
jgi:hypothetical protein